MTASPALNETRLPPAIQRRVAATQARIDARQATKTDPTPPAAETPPAVPPTETPPAPTAPAPVAPPVDARESDAAYWKQRWNTTDGILKAQARAHAEEMQRISGQIANLQSQLTEARSRPASADTIDVSRFFTPEQVDKYGEDQCRETVRIALAAAQAEVQRVVDTQVKPLAEARAQDRADEVKRRDQQLRDQVTELVPDWEHIEATDPGWFAFLTEDHPATGGPRQELLTHHVTRRNAKGIAQLFNEYRQSLVPPAAPIPPAPPAPPVTPHGSGAVDSVPPVTIPVAAGGVPSNAEVRAFYKRAALGQVSDQERVNFEARAKLRTGR